MGKRIVILKEPWEVPTPVDEDFIKRVKENIEQADQEVHTLIDELVPGAKKNGNFTHTTTLKLKPRRLQSNHKGPQELKGNCNGCGFPKTEYADGCKACYNRHQGRWKLHGIEIPARTDHGLTSKARRLEGPQPLEGRCSGCGFPKAENTKGCHPCFQRHYHRRHKHDIPIPDEIDRISGKPVEPAPKLPALSLPPPKISRELTLELHKAYAAGWSPYRIMEYKGLYAELGYKNAASASVMLTNKFHEHGLPVRANRRKAYDPPTEPVELPLIPQVTLLLLDWPEFRGA